jgi:hypothetical protein
MKRKSLLFTLLLALFMPWVANAQETVTIGDLENAGNDSYLPMNSLYEYSYTQQIYTAEEIGMTGTINSITVWLYGNANLYEMPFDIYMLEVDKTEFTDISDWVSVTASDIVYSGSVTVHNTDAEAYTFELSTPFVYTGEGNLVIAFDNNCGQWKSGLNGKVFTATDGVLRSLYIRRDSNNIDPLNMDGVSSSSNSATRAMRNVIELAITPASTGCDYMPTAIAVSDITAYGATVTWEGEGDTWNLRYKAPADDDYTMIEGLTSQTYTFEGILASNTTYSVGVQADCGDATSTFKSTTFTTANACAAPTNLQITNVTESSATLTWTPGYQETSWTVKYKKSTDSEYTTETVNGTPTLTLHDLDGLTTYNVQVYNCENYVSANFTTATGIPLNEAFNATSIPTGWSMYTGLLSSVMGGTALTPSTYGWSFGTSNNVFDSHARVNIYGNYQRWLVLPTLVMEDNVQITFDMALTVYSSSSSASPTPGNQADDKFIVLIQTENGWEILREWNNSGSEYVYDEITNAATGQHVAIDLSSYAGQSIAIAFYGESTENGGDNNLHIDNVSIDYIPACAKPTGLAASDVTAHEATITWTSDAAAWQVQLDDEDPIDVEEATYTFENLDPETAYTAKVRANCDGTYSEWTTAVSFTTTIACPAPTNLEVTPNALTATFTWQSNAGEWEVAYATEANADPAEFIAGTVNEATYTVNDLELGDYYFWVRANCGEVDGDSQWAGPVSVHIGYCVPNPSSHDGSGITGVSFGMGDYVVENGGEGVSIPATSPFYGDYTDMIGAVQAGVESTISITTATGSYPYTFVIWVDFDNSLSFEDSEIVYIGKASSGAGTLEASIVVPADQAVGDYRMRIYGADSYFNSFYNNGNTNWDANHDPCVSGSYRHANDYTLRVLEAPSCLIPTDLVINYTGGDEATISWTSDAEAWNMRVNGVDVEGTITNPYTLTGLELATVYSVEVQANCGDNGTSEWTNPVSFTTDLCMPEEMCAISYSFTDQYDDSWNEAYMNIVDATTGKVLHELTMPNVTGPYEGSFNVCDGRDIQFVWVSGSYPGECGYTFTHNGETILEKGTGETAPSAGVVLTYNVDCGFETLTKTIKGYNDPENPGGYYLIALPFDGGEEGVRPTTVDGMITDAFDLYYFDESQEEEWINYDPNMFNLVSGKGYLYASQDNTTLTFIGRPIEGNEGTCEVKLHYTEDAQWAGWNLVGNPFAVTATILDDYEFYTLDADGNKLVASSSNTVEAMEGIFVLAEQEQQPLTFAIDQEPAKSPTVALNLSNETGLVDRAIVRFGESHQLPKFTLRQNETKMYISKDNEDYAVVRSNKAGELPVNFEPAQNGTFTISVNIENLNVKYLHLIDRATGMDTDLLQTPIYKFDARTNDDPKRFVLVYKTIPGFNIFSALSTKGGNTDDFSFFSNGNWVINNDGDAILQVVDINGQILSSEQINGSVSKSIEAAPGIYMLRLINGENVKVQKIVVQ